MDAATALRRLNLIRAYLPHLLAADGSEAVHWTYAKSILFLADNILQQHYHRQERVLLADLTEIRTAIALLKPLRSLLLVIHLQDLTHFSKLGTWLRLKTSVQQVLPLVERILREQASGN